MKYGFVIFLFLSFTANAQEWVKVVSSENGDTYFVDIKSLLRIGNIQSYWELANYTKPTRNGDLSVLSNHRINCESKEFQTIVINFYMDINNQGDKSGTIYPKDQSWKPIKPDTIHSSLMRFVCKR